MNGERWCTKEDVLKDLAVATGRELKLDSSYLVVGERPPPRPVCEPDEEMELMFRDAIGEKPVDVATAPDLRGITEMIRMVQGYDNSSSDCNTNESSTRPKSPCDIISISKLNPNVTEFKPKGSLVSTDIANKSNGNKSPGRNKVNTKKTDPTSLRTNDSESGKITDKLMQDVVEKEIDVYSNDIIRLNENKSDVHELKNATAELISKIQQPIKSGVSTFQVKKERNVAIANLQKLLSAQAVGDGNKDKVEEAVKPMKLLTPDYYERPKTDGSIDKIRPQNKILHEQEIVDDMPSTKSNCSSSKPNGSTSEVIKKLLHSKLNGSMRTSSDPGIPNNASYSNSESKTLSTTSENKMDDSRSSENLYSDTNLSDPQVRDSIKKVNNWLNKNDGKTEAKKSASQVSSPSPPVMLAAITFKRKETRKSPNVSETKISKPSQNAIEQYKPSEYAEKLSKIYTERVNKIKKTKEKNGWANLEELLKEKDEKIRQEKLKAQSSEVSCDS